MFFSSEKELFSQTYLPKKTPRRAKIISPVWNKLLKIWDSFWAHKYGNTMQQKWVQALQRVGAFGNNMRNELRKPCPKGE